MTTVASAPFTASNSIPDLSNPASIPAQTVTDAFNATVTRRGDAIAIRQIVSNPTAEVASERFSETTYTWNDYSRQARSFAKALIATGLKPQQGVTVQGANDAHWLFANIGSILAGGIAAGSYATNNASNSQHVARNSESAVVVVENDHQLEKYIGLESTALKAFVVWNKVMDPSLKAKLPAPVYSWDEFLQKGEGLSDLALISRMASQSPDQVCSLIYTSGTTGLPKGAALTHDNLVWTAFVAGHEFSVVDADQGLSYLPLNHIAAQQLDAIVPLTFGFAVNIAPADALKGANLKQHIISTRPTYFLAVPRVWEKFKEGIEAKVALAPPLKKAMFNLATYAARKANGHAFEGKDFINTTARKIQHSIDGVFLAGADKLVLSKLKTALGLNRARITATGAAPFRPDVREFFESLDIRVIDLYGMSESSGPTTLSLDSDVPAGSVGRALPGTEMMIANPDENGVGEIKVRGRHVFKEYWKNPEKTAEALDADGWLCSGDLGRLDKDGNLFITGRLKELIITAGGENIPPVEIENAIQKELPIVSTCVVIGDHRKYLTALATLATEVDSEGKPTNQLTHDVIATLAASGSSATTLEEASQDSKVLSLVMEGIARANKHAHSRAQYVQKVTILPEELSVDQGTLTPTLKIKRGDVAKYFADHIEKMYA